MTEVVIERQRQPGGTHVNWGCTKQTRNVVALVIEEQSHEVNLVNLLNANPLDNPVVLPFLILQTRKWRLRQVKSLVQNPHGYQMAGTEGKPDSTVKCPTDIGLLLSRPSNSGTQVKYLNESRGNTESEEKR